MSSAIKTKPSLWKSIVARVKAGSKGGDAQESFNKQDSNDCKYCEI